MKWHKQIGAAIAGALAVFLYFLLKPDNEEAIKKKKAKAKAKLYKKVNASNKRSDKRQKKIKDKWSTIVKILLIITILGTTVNAEYRIYDTKEQVWRDYGHITNYVHALEERVEDYEITRKSNTTIVTNTVKEIIDDNCLPTWWETNGDWISGIGGAAIVSFFFWLFSSMGS